VLNLEQWTQGSKGMNPIGRPHLLGCRFGIDPCVILGEPYKLGAVPWYYLILLVGLGSVLAITRMRDSRLGRAWTAIRDDEIAAVSMGINPVTTKLLAFALGASFSGFAGAIFGAYLQFIDPGQFDFSISVLVLCMVILGGTGNVYGVILGGLIIASFDRIFAERLTGWIHALGDLLGAAGTLTFTAALPGQPPQPVVFSPRGILKSVNLVNSRLLIFGLALVLLMVLRPQGILPTHRRRWTAPSDEAPDAPDASASPPTTFLETESAESSGRAGSSDKGDAQGPSTVQGLGV
jgi:branched-chain amino acid transport system permease protein